MRALLFAAIAALAACSDDAQVPKDAAVPNDAGPDAGPDASCFTNPTTHYEIINACTPDSVQKIYKTTNLPLLNADGTLPPLP